MTASSIPHRFPLPRVTPRRRLGERRHEPDSVCALHARRNAPARLERFFYRKHRCYVGLEAEVPNPGDFKRTAIGERSVILVRDAQGELIVVENVCAHRGMQFCRERHGNRKDSSAPTTSGATS